MSSGFVLVSFGGPLFELADMEPPPRVVPLGRVKRVLEGESSRDWSERSRYDEDDVAPKSSNDPTESVGEDGKSDSFFDLIGAMKSSDADDPHDSFLDEIGALSRKRRR